MSSFHSPSSRLLLVLATAAAAAATSHAQEPPLPANPTRLLVKVKKGATQDEVRAAHARAGAELVRDLPQIGWQIVAVPHGRNVAVQQRYAREPAIERADLDRAKRLAYVPNDPLWPYEWHMVNITADQAWNTVKGDPAVVVAVMDTGLETTHPDLSPNVWVNPGEIAGNGLDDDGNGYIDDLNGYDFAYGDPVPDDVYGHGTSCAGIVAARQDNGIGMSGVAPYCRLAGIKAALDSGYFYDSANVPAFLYCADMGFNVISMSFFADDVTPAERDAVDYCWQKGLVLVAAAGNDSRVVPYYPGAYEHVIAVAAIDSGNNRAWFSNYGSWVDVAAPGLDTQATWIGGGYTGFSGTSAAAPHVAGLAALLFSAKSGATNDEVRIALEDTAIPVTASPIGEYTNYGRIDCKAAIDRIQGTTSGSKPARFLYAAPVGGDPDLLFTHELAQPRPVVRFFGVGLEQPNRVRVLRNHRPQPIVLQQRRQVNAGLMLLGEPRTGAAGLAGDLTYELEVNRNVVGSFVWKLGPGLVYAPSDASTFSRTLLGGFPELCNVDGTVLTCDAAGLGSIYVDLPVRKIKPLRPGQLTLEWTRAYDDCNGGTEYVAIYDWSTWSYPYGSWLTLSTRSITSNAMETVTATISTNPGNYLDSEGTSYFYVYTTGAGSSGLLRADAFRLRAE